MISTNRPARILLIEDSEMDRVIFNLMIKKMLDNPVIETCNNGITAISRLMELNSLGNDLLPDYIFLDLAMPLMDGWQFMEEYDRLDIDPTHKSKIYVLSSSVFKKDIVKSHLNPRIENFLSKPIDFGTIKNVFFSN
ncbi:response regulator [Mucilaginibacter celer]|uniref:Response regulator n=1 Tax=Mucilaginibacter celer TaxID=2305508 RepID=A0A494VUW3_9SPHI|nr:response regulator [Mucilaginibacter celer]AYL95223.1 response regulator [Mucilaginibacter celer]